MGISTHSQPRTLFIISAESNKKTIEDNVVCVHNLQKTLTESGIYFENIKGRYKGIDEQSILIHQQDLSRDHTINLAKDYDQESILELRNHKHGIYKAYLVFLDDLREEFIGYFRSIPKEYIDKYELDYSRNEANEYFGVWATDTTIITEFNKELQNYANGL